MILKYDRGDSQSFHSVASIGELRFEKIATRSEDGSFCLHFSFSYVSISQKLRIDDCLLHE